MNIPAILHHISLLAKSSGLWPILCGIAGFILSLLGGIKLIFDIQKTQLDSRKTQIDTIMTEAKLPIEPHTVQAPSIVELKIFSRPDELISKERLLSVLNDYRKSILIFAFVLALCGAGAIMGVSSDALVWATPAAVCAKVDVFVSAVDVKLGAALISCLIIFASLLIYEFGEKRRSRRIARALFNRSRYGTKQLTMRRAMASVLFQSNWSPIILPLYVVLVSGLQP